MTARQAPTPPQPDDVLLPPITHIERRAAALLLLTIALILGAALYLMYARGVFEPTQTLTLVTDDSEGVTIGMDITFSGFPIGRVRRLALAEDGSVHIQADIYRKDAHWLRTTSVFTLVKGLVGGTTIKAYSGILDDPPMPDGAQRPVLRGDMTSDIPQIMASARDLLGNLGSLTAEDAALAQTLAELRRLTQTLNTPGGVPQTLLGSRSEARKLSDALAHTNQLLLRLDQSVARADRQLLGADGLVANLNTLLLQSRESLQRVDRILGNAEKISTDVSDATTDLRPLRDEVQANLHKVEALLDDLQATWPFAKPATLPLP